MLYSNQIMSGKKEKTSNDDDGNDAQKKEQRKEWTQQFGLPR